MLAKAEGNFNIFSPSYWLGELDLRPLGFMRIVFGAVLIMSVADIAPVLFTFLSDDGVMPRHALLNGLARADRFSLFYAVGPRWLLVGLFAATLLSLASFCVGYRTRASNLVAFVLTCSLHERNLMAFDGVDNVIRVMLFWMLFMPSGARYSIDAVLAGARGEPVRETGPALPIRLGQLQIAWVYANTVMHKWPGASWHNGAALHTALGLDHLFVRTLGKLLFQVPWLTSMGTHFAVVAERSFLPLVFLPVFQTPAIRAWIEKRSPGMRVTLPLLFQPTYKALAIVYGTALHLGIALMMSIGNFSYIMIASYLLLFETSWTVALVAGIGRVWRRLVGGGELDGTSPASPERGRKLDGTSPAPLERGRRLRVLYDGECGFCVRVARVLRGLDAFETLELIDFRQADALAGLPEVPTTPRQEPGTYPPIPTADLERRMHVLEWHASGLGGASGWQVKAGFRGFVAVARRVPALALLGLLGSIPGAALLGDPVYDYLAARRQQLHPRCDGTCALPSRPDRLLDRLRRLLPPSVSLAGRGLLFAWLVYLALSSAWFSFPSTMKAFDRPIDPDTHMPSWMTTSVQSLELWQKWDMFSPNPTDTDIYLMGRGELMDGTQVDVLRGDGRGGPMPPIGPGLFFNRWTKFVHNLAYANQSWLVEFGRYICRHWNNDAPPGRAQLKTFKIYREQRRVNDVGKSPGTWGEQMLWDHKCF